VVEEQQRKMFSFHHYEFAGQMIGHTDSIHALAMLKKENIWPVAVSHFMTWNKTWF
jgi:hypothetical protein